MVRVLQNWLEIGEGILGFQKLGLPLHQTAQKNWDHWLLYHALARVAKNSPIADLGCGEGHTLRVLRALGFESIEGVDSRVPIELRARQVLAMYRDRTLHVPYHLHRGSIFSSPLETGAYGAVASISTIEHGCDLAQFFREAVRLLCHGGLLFVTTDYWEKKIDTSEAPRVYGLPWQIFCREQIIEMIAVAETAGLKLVNEDEIPRCSDRTVYWNGYAYTFIAMLFRKLDHGC